MTMGRGKSREVLDLIHQMRAILSEIQPATVRQLCYQLFDHKLIPSMGSNETKTVSKHLTWARQNEVVPFEWIVDEAREIEKAATWASADRLLTSVRKVYRRDRWQRQASRVLVVSEKGTIRGSVNPILDEYGLDFLAMKGFTSTTIIHDLAVSALDERRNTVLLYIGDYDPSGMFMSERDLPDRLDRYMRQAAQARGLDAHGPRPTITRVALTKRDLTTLRHLASSRFDAEDKDEDARYQWFIGEGGDLCCEVDAMSPPILRRRLKAAIEPLIDREQWEREGLAERAEIQSLDSVLSTWAGIRGQVAEYEGGPR